MWLSDSCVLSRATHDHNVLHGGGITIYFPLSIVRAPCLVLSFSVSRLFCPFCGVLLLCTALGNSTWSCVHIYMLAVAFPTFLDADRPKCFYCFNARRCTDERHSVVLVDAFSFGSAEFRLLCSAGHSVVVSVVLPRQSIAPIARCSSFKFMGARRGVCSCGSVVAGWFKFQRYFFAQSSRSHVQLGHKWLGSLLWCRLTRRHREGPFGGTEVGALVPPCQRLRDGI